MLASSVLGGGAEGEAVFVALFDATGRRNYERELLAARREADRSERRVRVLAGDSALCPEHRGAPAEVRSPREPPALSVSKHGVAAPLVNL